MPGILKNFYDWMGWNKKFHRYDVKVDINKSPSIILSPVQATVQDIGEIADGILLAKGKKIDIRSLLGLRAEDFTSYINLYLSPKDIHHFRTPYEGYFSYTLYNEGRSKLPIPVFFQKLPLLRHSDIFQIAIDINSTLTCVYQTKDFSIAMIAVGSFNVNSITHTYEEKKHYQRGMPFGHFNMGSSMLMLFPPEIEIKVKEREKIALCQPIAGIISYSLPL